MNADTPILGRRNVAAAFGVHASTLKRWQNDLDVELRLRLRDFVFKLNARWATTPRLAAQFVDHVRSIDPRESVRHEVAEVRDELREKQAGGVS